MTGAALARWAPINRLAQRQITEKVIAKQGLTADQIEEATAFRSPNEKEPVQPVYKAGPRDGVWATGPFLHNGSVSICFRRRRGMGCSIRLWTLMV
jgi:hypothetical protein